jgi:chemotaxis signal transduction protein
MNPIIDLSSPDIKQVDRYLIALVKEQKIAFSASLVREILVFQKGQILQLPFYDRSLEGVVHHQNQIIPLVSGRSIFLEETNNNKFSPTILTVVRLNELGQHLTGVGVVVDRMVESLSSPELTGEQLFQLTDIPQHIWQPLF